MSSDKTSTDETSTEYMDWFARGRDLGLQLGKSRLDGQIEGMLIPYEADVAGLCAEASALVDKIKQSNYTPGAIVRSRIDELRLVVDKLADSQAKLSVLMMMRSRL